MKPPAVAMPPLTVTVPPLLLIFRRSWRYMNCWSPSLCRRSLLHKAIAAWYLPLIPVPSVASGRRHWARCSLLPYRHYLCFRRRFRPRRRRRSPSPFRRSPLPCRHYLLSPPLPAQHPPPAAVTLPSLSSVTVSSAPSGTPIPQHHFRS